MDAPPITADVTASLGQMSRTAAQAATQAKAAAWITLLNWAEGQGVRSRAALGAAIEAACFDMPSGSVRDTMMAASQRLRAAGGDQ